MRGQQPRILIVVDVQKGFVTEHSRHILAPIEHIQQRFDQVFFAKFINPNPSPFREILDYHKLSRGSGGTALALRPRRDAPIIEHGCYSCLTPKLRKHLAGLGAREAYLCGIATEACVLKTAGDLFESNIRPRVLKDLCASDQNRKYHDMAIELLAKLIGNDNMTHSREIG